jgi:predicted anti-sigma-YlaC factor YlaD
MTCRELVELVTDYLEGRLPDVTRRQLEEHLTLCDGCGTYIEQMRLTLEALGRIPEETISVAAREELIATFRDLRPSAA